MAHIAITDCLALGGKPLGTLTLSGSPKVGYTLRQGLTGPVLAQGDHEMILNALALCMSPHIDNYTLPTYDSDPERREHEGT